MTSSTVGLCSCVVRNVFIFSYVFVTPMLGMKPSLQTAFTCPGVLFLYTQLALLSKTCDIRGFHSQPVKPNALTKKDPHPRVCIN